MAAFGEVRQVLAPEPALATEARDRAASAPAPEIGALLAWAVRTVDASAVIEVGSAGGVTGVWLLEALGDDGALTSIDGDPHTHGLATSVFEQIGVRARVRSILGQPDAVLPRLADQAYDLVLVQSWPPLSTDMLGHVGRLLRQDGVLVVRGAAQGGEHAETLAAALQELSEDRRFTCALLPIDGGLLVATRRGTS